MDTERITFPDGNWWELRTVITRRMRKAINKASFKALGPAAAAVASGVTDAASLRQTALSNADQLDFGYVEDAMLLEGTVAYSYGVVSLEVIDGLPDAVVNKVLARCNELYSGVPEEDRKRFFGEPSKPTSVSKEPDSPQS